MSQAGGPNSAGSVNIDFTGNVAPLEQAAKKAEAVVEQSAAKMKAAAGASPTASPSYMPGENFGPMYSATASVVETSTKAKARSFQNLIKPMNEVLNAYSRLIGIGSLIAGMAGTVVWAFNYKAQAAKKLKEDIDSLRESTKASFDQFTETDAPTSALDKYEKKLKAIDDLEKEKIKQAKALRDGTGEGARLASAGITAAENAAFEARGEAERQFTKDKNEEEKKRLQANKAMNEKAAQEQASLDARVAGGYAEIYMNAEAQMQQAGETASGELLQVRLDAIAFERDEKIKAMDEANKKIADSAIEQERRVDRERRRLMENFYRDLRAQQTQGTEVSGFAAGNLSQSLDLLNRQRSAVEGMSINYGGD